MTAVRTSHRRSWPQALAGVALAALAGAAAAHDTWFEPLPAAAGELRLALGTGDKFPLHEFTVGPDHLARHGCAGPSGPVMPMTSVGATPTALLLTAQAAPGGLSCWAQLLPFEIELPADKVRVYLDEINAPAAVRTAWAAMQARGQPWRERYTKHARIEIAGASASAVRRSGMGMGMGMDMLLHAAPGPLRPGDEIDVQVLRDGRPLPGFAVQLRSELSPLGLWRQTDADGRVRLRPPLPGRWLLRGTELTPPAADTGHWEGRFVTLAFDVAPPASRAGAMTPPPATRGLALAAP